MNRVVEEMLRHYVGSRQDGWDLLLPCTAFAINHTLQASIQTTPFHLNYGYHPTLPVDLAIPTNSLSQSFVQERQDIIRRAGKYFRFAEQRFNEDHLQAMVVTAKKFLESARDRQKRDAD